MIPGDIVTFWYRKFGSNRSSRVWCRVEAINADGTITARLPSGWGYPTRTLPAARFTKHEQVGVVSK